jgi:NADPH-dependent 2,4-dienoyl-CoA reductase/sulfur reductase-like enzyme
MNPQQKRFLIVGANAAGLKAASKARRRDPHLAITVVERDATISFAGCGLPYYLSEPAGLGSSQHPAGRGFTQREVPGGWRYRLALRP